MKISAVSIENINNTVDRKHILAAYQQNTQVKPFYCAHQCAVQLAGGKLVECAWDQSTLLPDMAQLTREVEAGVKMVVITTPGELVIDSSTGKV